jgi:hypothetical protein
MWKQLYKTFYYEIFFYVVDVPTEKVVKQLDHLFNEESGFLKSPNLSGRFVDYPDSFYITPKWSLMIIRNFEREPAILKGVITKLSETQTKIEIAVRPNSIFLILSVILLPVGLFNLYREVTTKNLNTIWAVLFLLIFIPLLYILARVSSNRLRKAFEKYMNVKPVTP